MQNSFRSALQKGLAVFQTCLVVPLQKGCAWVCLYPCRRAVFGFVCLLQKECVGVFVPPAEGVWVGFVCPLQKVRWCVWFLVPCRRGVLGLFVNMAIILGGQGPREQCLAWTVFLHGQLRMAGLSIQERGGWLGGG